MTWKVHVQSLMPNGEIGDALFIFKEDRDGHQVVVGPLVLKPVTFEAIHRDEMIRFSGVTQEVNDFLRAFADAAWERGIKPTAFTDHQGELAATQRHLDDFRKMLFHKERIK